MAGSQPLTVALSEAAAGPGGPLPGGVAGTGGMRRDGGGPRAGGRDVTVRPVVTVIGGDRHESLRVGGRGIMCTLRDSESLARSLSGSLSPAGRVTARAARSEGLGPRLTGRPGVVGNL